MVVGGASQNVMYLFEILIVFLLKKMTKFPFQLQFESCARRGKKIEFTSIDLNSDTLKSLPNYLFKLLSCKNQHFP